MNKTPVSPLTLWHVVSVRVAYGSFLFATHSSTLSITRPICYHNRNHSWLRKQHLWHLSKPPIHQKNLSNNIWHGKWKFSLNNAKKLLQATHTLWHFASVHVAYGSVLFAVNGFLGSWHIIDDTQLIVCNNLEFMKKITHCPCFELLV